MRKFKPRRKIRKRGRRSYSSRRKKSYKKRSGASRISIGYRM